MNVYHHILLFSVTTIRVLLLNLYVRHKQITLLA